MTSSDLYALADQWFDHAIRNASFPSDDQVRVAGAPAIDAMFNIAEHLKLAAFCAEKTEQASA